VLDSQQQFSQYFRGKIRLAAGKDKAASGLRPDAARGHHHS
jgi:hypothetical protein